ALRTAMGQALSPAEQAARGRWLEAAHAAAGSRAATAWTAGHAMPLEQAIAVALAEAPSAIAPSDVAALPTPAAPPRALRARPAPAAAAPSDRVAPWVPAAGGGAANLTARERAVAALIAAGCH